MVHSWETATEASKYYCWARIEKKQINEKLEIVPVLHLPH